MTTATGAAGDARPAHLSLHALAREAERGEGPALMFAPGGPTLLELARQALSSTDRGYDLLAPKFDRTPYRTPDTLIAAVLDGLAASHGSPRAAPGDAADVAANAVVDDALDVCCGTGAATVPLRALCRRSVVGIDRSAGMLAVCAARLALPARPGAPVEEWPPGGVGDARDGDARAGDARGGEVRLSVTRAPPPRAAPTAALVRADACALPFVERFDLAVSFGAFGHIEERDEPRFLASIHRALRPGGRFVFVTSAAPPTWSRAHVTARAFNAAMRVRNALIRPPFVMYYLTFLLPDVTRQLQDAGFDVEVRPEPLPAPFGRGRIVIATRRA